LRARARASFLSLLLWNIRENLLRGRSEICLLPLFPCPDQPAYETHEPYAFPPPPCSTEYKITVCGGSRGFRFTKHVPPVSYSSVICTV
jgi:hypothetical protein